LQCFPRAGHEIFPADLCLSLYSPAVHSLAVNDLNLTLSIGAGSSASVVAGASDEIGVVYGNDGSYGCYLTFCAGAVTAAGIADFVALGFTASYADFAGASVAVVESVGIGEGVSLSFSTSQVFSQGGLFDPAALTGTQDALSIEVGVSLPLSGAIFQCNTIVDTVKTLAPAGVLAMPLPGGAPKPKPTLAAAVLPVSRSVQVGSPATAFATIINLGATAASGCAPALETALAHAAFAFHRTDPVTNRPIGSPNVPANIPAGGSQSFVIGITPAADLDATDVRFRFVCAGADAAPVTPGLNTLLLSASSAPTPDVVALAATPLGDGTVHVPGVGGTGVFSVATVNVGGGGTVASIDTGALALPLEVTICETDPKTSVCLGAPAATATRHMGAGATSTFAVFVRAFGPVGFSPATKRLVVRFRDAGDVVRGATSVAVRTD
jgi:hypothetical protein